MKTVSLRCLGDFFHGLWSVRCDNKHFFQILVLAALVAVALARPQSSKDAQILKYESENIGIDGYKFAYETSDGQSRQETAELKNVGTENEAMVIRGSFTWRDADGKDYTITFVADETGYHPEGAHLVH